jgi:hypothetical protein
VASLKLTEEAARDVLLVRSIEAEDVASAILTRDDRQHATAVALQSNSLRDRPNARETASFLTRCSLPQAAAHTQLGTLAAMAELGAPHRRVCAGPDQQRH